MGDIIQFPKIVKLATLWNEGTYGLSVDNVKDVTVYESSIMIWFSEGRTDGRPWDLSLEYSSASEAEDSYHELLDAIREIRFRGFNKKD